MVLLISALYICGIIGATICLYKRDNNSASEKLMETVILQGDPVPTGEIFKWAKQQDITVDYKGALK